MIISWLQSKLGPRFFIPRKCIPGLFEYKVKIEKLTAEEKTKGCPICLFELSESPLADPDENTESVSQGNTNSAPLIKKVKHVYKTPCGHIFHESCLKNWINLKPECPSCRGALPDYY